METDYSKQDHAWHNYRAASEAFEQGHYSKASKILRQALSEADSIDPLLVNSANTLAERYFTDGNYANAAPLYRIVLEVRTKELGCDHPEVQESRRKLAMALWQSGGLSPKLLAANQ